MFFGKLTRRLIIVLIPLLFNRALAVLFEMGDYCTRVSPIITLQHSKVQKIIGAYGQIKGQL